MTNTMAVVIAVSRRDGQVTLRVSSRTSCKNLNGDVAIPVQSRSQTVLNKSQCSYGRHFAQVLQVAELASDLSLAGVAELTYFSIYRHFLKSGSIFRPV